MVRVSVPATSANLGPGFDTLGVALELRNIIEMEETGILDVVIDVPGHGDLLERPENNMVYQAAVAVFERLGYRPHGLHIREEVAIPVARGMGSSAAAIVGGLVAGNALAAQMTGRPGLSREELLRMAVAMEGHPDNVTPAMVGGFTVSCMDEARGPLHVRFDPPRGLTAVVVMPEVPITGKKTEKSRGVLPTAVTMKDAVYNLNRTALLVAALAQGRVDLLAVATQDRLHQPYRASLVPGLRAVFEAALDAGAKGVALSGAGPSVIAFVDREAEPVARAMEGAFQWAGSDARSLVVGLAREGARVLGEKQAIDAAPYWG
ncbi:MAG TPA: homoserine kinase [Symbiobacteriaceae bacterium]|nr:homoserine kinase [Symbiobacteriaceae bacterium]